MRRREDSGREGDVGSDGRGGSPNRKMEEGRWPSGMVEERGRGAGGFGEGLTDGGKTFKNRSSRVR